MRSIYSLISLAALVIAPMHGAQALRFAPEVDWPEFLKRHDLIWERMPKRWFEAPFVGNGTMGAMVRQVDPHTVRWDIGHGKVQDFRDESGMYGRCRLPIGHFNLKTVGQIKSGRIKLDLWNAEATGTIHTTEGTIEWKCFVPSDHMVVIAEISPSDGEQACRWEWAALPAASPRQRIGKRLEGYQPNPPSRQESVADVQVCIQPLLAGGEIATAWKTAQSNNRQRLLVSVAQTFPGSGARKQAIDEVRAAVAVPMAELVAEHREWWHAYYPASFVSIPAPAWESHYWIQIYKLASATRRDGMLIDNQGPWLQPTPWPGAWWNLNVQLSYWPTYGSNRLELGESLTRALYGNVERLILNVPEPYRADSVGIGRTSGQYLHSAVDAPDGSNSGKAPEIGLLLWACHNAWLHYRHSMDEAELRDHLFPLLRRAVNYHLHFTTKGEDGKYHLPTTFSPEYPFGAGPNCNFDLALLRWGCRTLVEASELLGVEDPLHPKWQDVLENLSDYPVGDDGYMIADGVPFAKGHRHYSHLLMLYPLYLVNREQSGAEELAIRSLEHWQSLDAKRGYSNTGASSIAAAFGRGNEALDYLDGLRKFFQANTLYKEAGPVIETPLSAAQCIHDMLIQSWGDKIRIFPAVPDAWSDVAFHDLRTEGAFLVSAKRSAGQTQFVRIKSLAGQPCRIVHGMQGQIRSNKNGIVPVEVAPGVVEITLKQDEEIVLYPGTEMPELILNPVETDPGKWNPFGLKK
jgi:hypothetical protein